MPQAKCSGCGRNAIKKPTPICMTCHREIIDRSKAGRGHKAKGSSFERDVAKKFSLWWGEVDSFRRTPMSGAWDVRAGGDLVTPPGFPFCVECKAQEAWKLELLLTSKLQSDLLSEFWKQTVRESAEAGKKPMLVFTKKFQPEFFMMTAADLNGLTKSVDGIRMLVLMHEDDVPLMVGVLDDLLDRWEK